MNFGGQFVTNECTGAGHGEYREEREQGTNPFCATERVPEWEYRNKKGRVLKDIEGNEDAVGGGFMGE